MARVAEIAERRDVIVIADEIHADLVFAPNRVVPAVSLGEREHLFEEARTLLRQDLFGTRSASAQASPAAGQAQG